MSSVSNNVTPSMLYTGRVKWFNNKAGYGFITVVSTPSDSEVEKNTDIFAHHTSIQVNEEQYKYLVQGEYVQFSLSSIDNGDHKFQAKSVSGISGGQLLCETRNNIRSSNPVSHSSRTSSSERRSQNRGTYPDDNDHEGWKIAKNKSSRRSVNKNQQSKSR